MKANEWDQRFGELEAGVTDLERKVEAFTACPIEAAALTEQLRVAVKAVYARHDSNKPLNHVNVSEWVEAVEPILSARLADSRPPVTEAAITEAEQRGRLAAAWDEGYTDCLAGDTCRCHGNPYRLSPTGDDSE